MKTKKKPYGEDFYKDRNALTEHAAGRVLDILKEYGSISSVVDVGGGIGTWVRTAKEKFGCRTEDILLIDGNYVDPALLQIEKTRFIPQDLEKRITVGRRFDLAISLEVAEHLSRQRAAAFVEDLTKLSDLVLFSAAIPYQGGTEHVNEQPLSYWVKLFSDYYYEAFDVIRPCIQSDQEIPFWYRQNIVVFVREGSEQWKQYVQKHKNLPPLNMVSYDAYMSIQNKIHSLFLYKIYKLFR